jgi:hypothetical protein
MQSQRNTVQQAQVAQLNCHPKPQPFRGTLPAAVQGKCAVHSNAVVSAALQSMTQCAGLLLLAAKNGVSMRQPYLQRVVQHAAGENGALAGGRQLDRHVPRSVAGRG